ncbi:MAG: hypothetical protein P1U57_14545, partial [Oleibacter sp.]|nr:hypothetical protein [Thalassolituus sp.]
MLDTIRAVCLSFVLCLIYTSAHAEISPENIPDVVAPTELTLEQIVAPLTSANFNEKEAIIANIAQHDTDLSLTILQALLNGDLYYVKKDERLIFQDDKSVQDVFSGDVITGLGKRDTKKITVNNSLRRVLRSEIA